MKFSAILLLVVGLVTTIGAGCVATDTVATPIEITPSSNNTTETYRVDPTEPIPEGEKNPSEESASETRNTQPASTPPVTSSTTASELQNLADDILEGLGEIDVSAANY